MAGLLCFQVSTNPNRQQESHMLTTSLTRFHTIRRPEDPSPCKVSGKRFDQERCGKREYQSGVGLSQHLHKNGADLGDEGQQQEIGGLTEEQCYSSSEEMGYYIWSW